MDLTSHEAYEKACTMWNWMADETERRQEKVEKYEYFEENGIGILNAPYGLCYCCEYARQGNHINCNKCPIIWPLTKETIDELKEADIYNENGRNDSCIDSIYQKWRETTDWQVAARLAREIANLPEYIDSQEDQN